MSLFNVFITFIFIIKIIFVILAVWHSYLVKKGSPLAKNIGFWKDRMEFIFIFCMSIVCIYLFNPSKIQVALDYETRFLLFVYGIIILITSNWKLFITQAGWFSTFQKLIAN